MTIKLVNDVLTDFFRLNLIKSNIYLESIPLEVKPDQSSLEILVEETENGPAYLGDDTFSGYKESYQISLFYGNNLDIAMERTTLEIILQKRLIDNGYAVVTSSAHYIDPETKQIIKNIVITKTQGLDGIV